MRIYNSHSIKGGKTTSMSGDLSGKMILCMIILLFTAFNTTILHGAEPNALYFPYDSTTYEGKTSMKAQGCMEVIAQSGKLNPSEMTTAKFEQLWKTVIDRKYWKFEVAFMADDVKAQESPDSGAVINTRIHMRGVHKVKLHSGELPNNVLTSVESAGCDLFPMRDTTKVLWNKGLFAYWSRDFHDISDKAHYDYYYAKTVIEATLEDIMTNLFGVVTCKAHHIDIDTYGEYDKEWGWQRSPAMTYQKKSSAKIDFDATIHELIFDTIPIFGLDDSGGTSGSIDAQYFDDPIAASFILISDLEVLNPGFMDSVYITGPGEIEVVDTSGKSSFTASFEKYCFALTTTRDTMTNLGLLSDGSLLVSYDNESDISSPFLENFIDRTIFGVGNPMWDKILPAISIVTDEDLATLTSGFTQSVSDIPATIYIGAVLMPNPFRISIEKVHNAYQGHYTSVALMLEDDYVDFGAFDFLIAYDNSALAFAKATPGQLLEDCGWEYFTYRHGVEGNCGDACPSGLLRIIAIAETNDGSNHPTCYGPDSIDPIVLATLSFMVSNDRTLECMYVPIQFYWNDCGDNIISSVDGNISYIDRAIFDFTGGLVWDEEDDDLYPESARIRGVGTPDSCLNADPEKPSPIRFVDFVNGGVDIICADSIDKRGDINLNGVANEIADATTLVNYFIYGLDAFTINTEGQIAATDVNADGIPLTVADLTYMIRIIVGDALPYAKISPATAEVIWRDGVLSVDANMGAVRVTCRGEVIPELIADGMDMKYAYDERDDLTSVLIYSMKADQTFRGDFLSVDGDVVDIELATYDGAMVRLATDLIPTSFALYQNYPNPFNPSTEIDFYLPVSTRAKIEIFNVAGQRVATIVDEELSVGRHTCRWDGTDAASGVYFYRLTAGDYVSSRKMMLLK